MTAAVAVPILIHLLNRRRFRRVSWAAMRFLRASIEKNRRRMELEDWILLALRCLMVLLLALALARPALRSAAAFLETGRAAAVLVLDRSGSMQAGDGVRTRFDLAKEAAEAALEAYPAGSTVAMVLGADRLEEPVGEPAFDLARVRQAVREATVSELGTDHAVGLLRALEVLGGQTALRKEIVLVTDRQGWGWRRWPEVEAALLEVAQDTRLRVVLVGAPVEENLSVVELSRSAGFATAGEPVRFQAEVAYRGGQPMRQVRATLHVNGGPAVDEALAEEMMPGESRRLTFFARLPSPGWHAVSVRLPADRMPADDGGTRMVRAVERVRVLVVDGDAESNGAFFLRQALQPVPREVAPEYFLQPRVVAAGQLAFTRLGDFDAVILSDVPPLASGAVDALARYVREGGALIGFAGPQAQEAFYHGELRDRTGLLPASLGGLKGNPESEEGVLHWEQGPYRHPVLTLWNEAGAGTLAGVRFLAGWEWVMPLAEAGRAGMDSEVIVRWADGTPAVVERRLGRGRAMWFGSTAGTGWNDLAVRPAFVPLLHRAVGLLAETAEAQRNGRVGMAMGVRMAPEWTGRDVVVTVPGVPERRVTRLVGAGEDGAQLVFEETVRAGVYGVAAPGDPTVLAQFAVWPDPAESDLTDWTPEQREEVEKRAQVIDWEPGQDLRALFERERVGVEIWWPLILGVLVLGCVESWLAQRFSRSK
ncbi:MAG: BatA domain-containing protein [Verrucomicrobiae bacterium]|nr:BatA domain-containing protein [Verrucomicrobiae bacterium]